MSHPKNLKTCGLQKHASFLSCCKLWYGTNRIWYNFVLIETGHAEFSILKMLKFKVPQWLWISTKAIWHDIHVETLVICYLLLHWALSNYLWPLLRFSSCAHDQDTRPLTNKQLTLTLKVTQKLVFSSTE